MIEIFSHISRDTIPNDSRLAGPAISAIAVRLHTARSLTACGRNTNRSHAGDTYYVTTEIKHETAHMLSHRVGPLNFTPRFQCRTQQSLR